MFPPDTRHWPWGPGANPLDLETLLWWVEHHTKDKPPTDSLRQEVRTARNGLLKCVRKIRGFMDVDVNLDPLDDNANPEHVDRDNWLQWLIRYAVYIGALCPPPDVTHPKTKNAASGRAITKEMKDIIEEIVSKDPEAKRGVIVTKARAEAKRLGVKQPDKNKDAGLLKHISKAKKYFGAV
jgi:hypothetical protein